MLTLEAYLDRGVKYDFGGIASVAAIVFKPTPYKQFVRPWNRMLRGWHAPAFHATDFYTGAQEFKRDTPEKKGRFDEDSKRIPVLIGEHIERALVISFLVDEFTQLATEEWKEKFGTNTHSLSVQLCLLSNGYWEQERHPGMKFAYFMESGDPGGAEVVATVERMRQNPVTRAHVRVRSFTPIGKGCARGLEAADFLAWQRNKFYMDKERIGKSDEPRRDFAAFVGVAAGKVREIFLSRHNLQHFFDKTSAKKQLGPADKT